MARVILSGHKAIVIEAKNIGFIGSLRDIASHELEGAENTAEEAIADAILSIPHGFEFESVNLQVYNNGKDYVAIVTARLITEGIEISHDN